jgi:hypothetical protein
MKAIMQKYHEVHEQGVVVLWFCFLHHFSVTTMEIIIDAYSHLSESKVRWSLYQGHVLQFTNAICAPLHRLIQANVTPSSSLSIYFTWLSADAPNEELQALFTVSRLIFGIMGPLVLRVFLIFLISLTLNKLGYIILADGLHRRILKFLPLWQISSQLFFSSKECASLQALVATKDKLQPSSSGHMNKPSK